MPSYSVETDLEMSSPTWEAFEHLAALLGRSRVLPVLFVGSGVSQRYTGAPCWKDLISSMCQLVDEEPEYILSSADYNLALASSKLVPPFHKAWWKHEQFAEHRAEFRGIQTSAASALKTEIAVHLTSAKEGFELGALEETELDLLKTSNIAGVITTNFDSLMETIFPQFEVYIGQERMLLSNPLGIAEIYKIHGCCSVPNSLILTQEDYEAYKTDNPYLLAKLLAIFVEHPIVFLGYSIQDENIRSILLTLAEVAARNDLLDLTDKIVFVEWDRRGRDPELTETPLIVDGTPIPITRIRVPDFIGVFRCLHQVREDLPMRVIRQFQSHIYEIVKGNPPKDKILVMGLDEIDNYREVEWAVGVGVHSALSEIGVVGLGRNDLIKDFLKDESSLDASLVATRAIPQIASSSVRFVPVYRYLREAGYIDSEGRLRLDEALEHKLSNVLHTSIDSYLPSPTIRRPHESRWRTQGPDLDSILNSTSFSNAMPSIALAFPGRLSVDQLREFLRATSHIAMDNDHCDSNWAKLVAQLDFVVYGPSAPPE